VVPENLGTLRRLSDFVARKTAERVTA